MENYQNLIEELEKLTSNSKTDAIIQNDNNLRMQVMKIFKELHHEIQNCNPSQKVCESLCFNPGMLIKLIELNLSKWCTLEGVRLLQLLTYKPTDDRILSVPQARQNITVGVISNCQKAALNCLKDLSLLEATSEVDSHICVACLSVIYNVLTHYSSEALTGLIVSVCQPYIFYKIRNLSKAQIRECEVPNMSDFLEEEDERETAQENAANRKRKRRLRRKKIQPPRPMIPSCVETKPISFITRFNFSRNTSANQDVSLKPQWMKTERSTDKQQIDCPSTNQELSTSINSGPSSCWKTDDQMTTTNFDALTLKQTDPCPEASVRECAIHVMNAVIDVAGKQNKFSFWPQLMCQEPSLMTCILRDPDCTVRMAALQTVNAFLIDSHSVLSLATDCEDVGSFTTLSKQLGTSVRALHRCLVLALLSEKIAQVLIRILKTLELLFEHVNYSKLKPGLLSKVVVHVKYFLKYKDTIVRANAFSAMVSFLKIKPKTLEMESILSRYQIPLAKAMRTPAIMQQLSYEEVCPGEELEDLQLQTASSDDCFSSDSSINSENVTTTVMWIVERCIDSLLNEEDVTSGMLIQVKMQSIKVLNALISEHFSLIQSSLPVVQNVISIYCNTSPSERLCPEERLVERMYLLLGSVLHTDGDKETLTNVSKENLHLTKSELLQLWLWALQNPLAHILTYPDKQLNMERNIGPTDSVEDHEIVCSSKIFLAGAAVLANLSAYVLQEIGEEYLYKIFRTVMFLVVHHEIGYKLCGIRIVGSTVGFPAVQESHCGVEIVQDAICSSCQILSSDEHNVKKNRLLAAWVLANISAALQQCRATWTSSKSGPFLSKNMIIKFFKAAICGCYDKDTISPPAIRSLGNLVSYLPAELTCDAEIRKYIDDVVNLLLKSCLNAHMKSRWNACHALGTILKHAKLSFELVDWMNHLVSTLSGLVKNFTNFKVRILACAALSNVSRRSYFVDEYVTAWKAFLIGADNLGNICGVQEVHHRDDLICQFSFGICHLVTLLEFNDLEHLEEVLELSKDTLKATMVQGDRLMPPEKANCFTKALHHVTTLLASDVISTKQERILNNILHFLKV